MNTPDSSQCITAADRPRSLLFLDKVFLKPRKANLRGVELFNLALIQDLARNGFSLTIPIHYSWQDDFKHEQSSSPPFFCKVSGRLNLLNGLMAAWLVRRRQYREIILANVANGLIPALWLLRIFRRPVPFVVFAHRMPSARFMAALPKKTTRVICVNGIIAAEFKKNGFKDVNVLFGHMNADKFCPGDGSGAEAGSNEKKVNFCVVGFLDNAWKGADTALAAFRALPKDVSAKCALHLASYRSPPSVPEQNIRVYEWLAPEAMPAWLRKMDVMIVPSRDEKVMRETFSLTMVEGMLTGLPIIASNLPVLAEKIADGGGYVFNDPGELSRLMASLASRPGLRAELGRQARRIALERYVWDAGKFISRYLV